MIETAAAIVASHVLAPHVAAGFHAVAPHVVAGVHWAAPHVVAGAHAAMPYAHSAVAAVVPHAQAAVTHAVSHAAVAHGLAAASKVGVMLPHFLSTHHAVVGAAAVAGAGAGAVAGAGTAAGVGSATSVGVGAGHAGAAATGGTAHHTSWIQHVAQKTAQRAGSRVAKRFYGPTLKELKSSEARKKVLAKIKTDGLGATGADMLRKMEADGLTG